MPSHQHLPSIGVDQAGPSVLTRRLYAAIVIGLAIFLLGLLLWPSPRSARTSLTVIEIETRSPEYSSRSQVEERLRQIQNECIRSDQLRALITELGERHPSATNVSLETVAENLSFRLLPNGGSITAQNRWRVEVAYVGTGKPFEPKLVGALGAEVTRRWQDSSTSGSSNPMLEEVCETLAIDIDRLLELSAQIPSLADRQWREIESALHSHYSTTSFDEHVQGAQGIEGPNNNVSPVDLNDFGPIGAPTLNAPQAHRHNTVENPNWIAISNERARLEEIYNKLSKQNQWPPSHPELQRLDRDLQLIYRQLAVTPRFVSTRDDAVVINNRGTRVPAQFVENARIGTLGTDTPTPSLALQNLDSKATLKIQQALREPMMDLHFEVTDIARGWNRSLDDMEAQRLEGSVPTIDSITVAEQAYTQRRTLPRGLGWRLSLITLIATIASIAVLTIVPRKESVTLESRESVELTLGLPIVGRLGTAAKTDSKIMKWRSLSTWTRVAESTVVVLVGLVLLVAIGEPNGVTDLAQNPLLTVCDILGSISRF